MGVLNHESSSSFDNLEQPEQLEKFEQPDSPTSPPSPTMHPTIYNEWRVLPIATLTSIATIIGSGILALPVTLYHTGLPVFLLLFTITLIAHIGVIYATVELLQRARLQLPATPPPSSSPPSSPSTNPINSSTYATMPPPPPPPQPVSLFSLAELYIHSSPTRFVYYVVTFLGFVAMLVSYGLAGPQAVWQLIHPGPAAVAPPISLFAGYWTIATIAVIFFVDALLPVFGSFTVLKGALFVAVIAIVACLPSAARVTSFSTLITDFEGIKQAASPFLVATVALGGLANTIPVTYKLLPVVPTKRQVANYRFAVVLAVIICYLLNIGWVIAILFVVPRTSDTGKPSLTHAFEVGQISTVPLIDTLHGGGVVVGSTLKSIEIIVELFIFVSTGVSFFVIAAGMKSFVDGAIDTAFRRFDIFRSERSQWVPRVVVHTMSFGLVLAIILADPNGFINILTRFSSFALNLQAGALIFLMLYNSRRISNAISGMRNNNEEDLENPAKVSSEVSSNNSIEGGKEDEQIPLEMSSFMAMSWIGYGVSFFGLGCILALIGPLLGIQLGPHE